MDLQSDSARVLAAPAAHHAFITVSAIPLGLSQIPFVINFFWSIAEAGG